MCARTWRGFNQLKEQSQSVGNLWFTSPGASVPGLWDIPNPVLLLTVDVELGGSKESCQGPCLQRISAAVLPTANQESSGCLGVRHTLERNQYPYQKERCFQREPRGGR